MEATTARNIILVGLMGSGKSALAKAIARKTGCPMLDTDQEIEKKFGKSIAAIFAEKGEEFFRDAETDLLKSCREKSGYVISTGGGMVIRPENRKILRETGFVIWLQASEDVLFERISRNKRRPLLHTPDPRATLRQLIIQRESWYQEIADIQVDTGIITRNIMIKKMLAAAGWNQSVA